MGMVDYQRQTLKLEALTQEQRRAEIARFAQRIRVFHYTTEAESLAPHGGGLSVKMVLRGAESFVVGAGTVRLRAGEALLMPPGVEYGSEISEPTESFSAFFPPSLCLDLVGGALGGALESAPVRSLSRQAPIPIAADACLRQALRRAHRALEAQDEVRAEELLQEAAQALLLTALDLARAGQRLDLQRAAQRRELLRRLQRARAFLHDNTSRPVFLDELARASQLSRFHLLRRFREAFGCTPAQYQAGLRLQRARILLEAREVPIFDVAREVGYVSHSAFARAWKRRFGTSPSDVLRSDSRGAPRNPPD